MTPLCTNCNQPVSPVVAIDIDGTLGKYHRHFLEFATGWLGRGMDLEYDGSVELAEWMGVDKQTYRQCKLAYRQGGMKRTMPAYGDTAPGIVNALRMNGVEVWITTTRPYLRLDNVDPDTREWLRRMHIDYDGLIYEDDKYARLLEIVGEERVIGVLDDLPECYDRAEQLGLQPVLAARLHNSTNPRPVMAPSLRAARLAFIDRAEGWYKAHALLDNRQPGARLRRGVGDTPQPDLVIRGHLASERSAEQSPERSTQS